MNGSAKANSNKRLILTRIAVAVSIMTIAGYLFSVLVCRKGQPAVQ